MPSKKNDCYFIAPPDVQFDEVKQKAIELWRLFDNTHGYVDEKVNAIEHLINVGDNFMPIVMMFDIGNQMILSRMLTNKTKLSIRERLLVVPVLSEHIPF